MTSSLVDRRTESGILVFSIMSFTVLARLYEMDDGDVGKGSTNRRSVMHGLLKKRLIVRDVIFNFRRHGPVRCHR